MTVLKPKNFQHIPLGYRPRHTIRVPKRFANQVREIRNLGGRADDEHIANTMTVLEDMRSLTPKLFNRGRPTHKGRPRKTHRRKAQHRQQTRKAAKSRTS